MQIDELVKVCRRLRYNLVFGLQSKVSCCCSKKKTSSLFPPPVLNNPYAFKGLTTARKCFPTHALCSSSTSDTQKRQSGMKIHRFRIKGKMRLLLRTNKCTKGLCWSYCSTNECEVCFKEESLTNLPLVNCVDLSYAEICYIAKRIQKCPFYAHLHIRTFSRFWIFNT